MNSLILTSAELTMSSREKVEQLLVESGGKESWDIAVYMIGKMNEFVAQFCERAGRGLPAADPSLLISATLGVADSSTDKQIAKAIRDACTVARSAVTGCYVWGAGRKRVSRDEATKTYFIACEETALIKIGSSVSPEGRIKALSTGSAASLILLATISANFEREYHRRFTTSRVHGEWFKSESVGAWLFAELNNKTRGSHVDFTPQGVAWVAQRFAQKSALKLEA